MDEETKNKVREQNIKIKEELVEKANKVAEDIASIKFKFIGAPIWKAFTQLKNSK